MSMLQRFSPLLSKLCPSSSTSFLTVFSSKNEHQSFHTISQKNENNRLLYTELTKRCIIKLHGTDVSQFLHGLVTNDVKGHFDQAGSEKSSQEANQSLYTFMLNIQGRVLYDFILYKSVVNQQDQILIECDKRVCEDVLKTLTTYRLRRQIKMDNLSIGCRVMVAFRPYEENSESGVAKLTEFMGKFPNNEKCMAFVDPRLSLLGCRVLNFGCNENLFDKECEKVDEKEYHKLRYTLGIAEGAEDLPPGNCLPLETNGDYLNGISFHKGCYIGQELTARTHHTGVVRKRLMPLFFEPGVDLIQLQLIPGDAKVFNENQETVGKFKNVCLDTGLGLLRIEQALKAKKLHIQVDGGREKFQCTTRKPKWWPDGLKISGEVHVSM